MVILLWILIFNDYGVVIDQCRNGSLEKINYALICVGKPFGG